MQEARGGVLRRGKSRMLAGVCSGLAEYFQIDPIFIRVAFVILAFIQGLGILLYLVLWVLMPAPDASGAMAPTLRENFRSMGDELRRMADDVRGIFSRSQANPPPSAAPEPPIAPSQEHMGPPDGYRRRRGIWAGVILVILGGILLLSNVGLLDWWKWEIFWPIVLIALGVLIVVQRLRPRV